MNLEELEAIEQSLEVEFLCRPPDHISVKGKQKHIDAALARIRDDRDEVIVLLRQRQGLPQPGEEIVERVIPTGVPSLAVQRENYVAWLSQRGRYYQPTPEQLDLMFAALEEGDLVIPDYALTFSVRKPNGRLIAINRKGLEQPVSPYSPAHGLRNGKQP